MSYTFKQVSAQRGWVTRTLKSAQLTLGKVNPPLSILKLQRDQLNARWSKYEEMWSSFEEECLRDDEDIESESQAHELKEAEVDGIRLQLEFAISAAASAVPQPQLPDSTGSQVSTPRFKMPDIHLPEFNGDTEKWPTFWDTFDSLVHSRAELTPVVKFTYLRRALKGRAADAIRGYQTTETHYEDALETLRTNFADINKLQRGLLRRWFQIKPPKYDVKELLDFKIEYETTLRSLSNYFPVSTAEWMTKEKVLLLLPVEATEYIYNRAKTQYPSLNEISECLQTLIDFLSQKPKHQKEQASTSSQHQNPQTPAKSSSQSSQTKTKNHVGSYSMAIKERKCLFCQKTDHHSRNCLNYSTVRARRNRVTELKRCPRCISTEHEVSDCQAKFTPCRTCGKDNHHGLFCFKSAMATNKSQPAVTNGAVAQMTTKSASSNSPILSADSSSKETTPSTAVVEITTTHQVIGNCKLSISALPTATAQVMNEEIQCPVSCRLFFDIGSQRSFITTKLKEQLQLSPVDKITMNISAFRQEPVETQNFVVEPVIKLGKRSHKVKVVVVEDLNMAIHTPGLVDTADLLKAKGVNLADKHLDTDVVSHVDMIIGSDYFSNFITGLTNMHGINLLNSSGGKLIYGPVLPSEQTAQSSSTAAMNVTVMRVTDSHSPLSTSQLIEERTTDMHKLWDLDTIGIKPNEMAHDDKLTYQKYVDTVQYDSGQYWVRLPWKPNAPQLPSNYRMALGQLQSLLTSLKGKPMYLQHYDKVIQDQLQSKFIELVPNNGKPKHLCHYLPHHAVEKDSQTTPLRVVFNCSAKAGKGIPSLNDCLLTGPSLTEKLGDVLINFRTEKFAYTADISKAFLRVGLQETDRDFTRFLWVNDIHADSPKIVTYRFSSVLFGATCSPFLLQATLAKHLESSESPLKELLSRNFYVDNFQGVTSDENSLLQIFTEANRELGMANMPLQTWNSNSTLLQAYIQETFPEDELPTRVSVLGMSWDTSTDTFYLKPVKFRTFKSLTKRKLLSLVSSTFDPLGLVTPLTIKGKSLIQSSWSEKTDWDTKLCDKYLKAWTTIQSDLELVHTIPFPRSVGSCHNPSQLHVFCDASSEAYGAVAYVVSQNQSNLFISKARVNPVPPRTLPQMELTALQVGVQLAHYIVNSTKFQYEKVAIWSDNEASLQWVRNQQSTITYVKNRVNEIRRLSETFQLLHVPSKENPADMLSRGVSLKTFTESKLWFHGPEWLTSGGWPTQKSHVIVNELTLELEPNIPPVPILNNEEFSSLSQLLTITKYVLKFAQNLRPTMKKISAIQYWLQLAQQTHFGHIMKMLTKPLPVTGHLESKLMIRDLGLYIDPHGLIRSRGRIQNSTLPIDTRYPILLPPKSHFAKLLIRKAHTDVLHGGVQETLAQLRMEYWIPKGRQAVKGVISKCNLCRRVSGQPYKYPGPPPLPEHRVQLNSPFHTTGVDYTGAIQLSKTKSGLPEKVYVCLFTCTASRAIHLELAQDLSADTFLLLFRRFCARRSLPKCLISDNATNFVATSKFLQALAEEPSVKQFLNHNQIQWHFIAPRAPWQGGFYERLIGVVKDCIRKVLYHRRVTEAELVTILAEIETRVNNRPLTYLTEDAHDEALTPSHLLHARRLKTMPLLTEDDPSDQPYLEECDLRNQYVAISRIIRKFESVWKTEYLTALRERHYGAQKPTDKNQIKVGDIVLVQVDRSRNEWPLGKIVNIHGNPENTIRSVDVLCAGKISVRTVDKLVPLEVSSANIVQKESHLAESEESSVELLSQVEPSVRPKRKAATQAEALRQQLIRDDLL